MAVAAQKYLTTREVAELLGVDVGKVTDWINQGDLAAINVALASGGVRPRWRIPEQAFEAFLVSRQSHTPAQRAARRQRDEGVTKYF